jgi:hypothetical protein
LPVYVVASRVGTSCPFTGVPRPYLGSDRRKYYRRGCMSKTTTCKRGNKNDSTVSRLSDVGRICTNLDTKSCDPETLSKRVKYLLSPQESTCFFHGPPSPVASVSAIHGQCLYYSSFLCCSSDMATHSTVQTLVKTRLNHIKKASESRDVGALMPWYSKDAVFVDPGATCFPLHVMPVDSHKFNCLK